MPKIRQLVTDLEQAGDRLESTRGSHRKFRHPRVTGAVILSANHGDDAHHYQERDVRAAVRKIPPS